MTGLQALQLLTAKMDNLETTSKNQSSFTSATTYKNHMREEFTLTIMKEILTVSMVSQETCSVMGVT